MKFLIIVLVVCLLTLSVVGCAQPASNPQVKKKSENSSVDKSGDMPEQTTGVDPGEHQEESSSGLSTKEKAVSPQPMAP